MKTILVTGATGFLGHHVVKEMLKTGDIQVIAIGGRPEDKTNSLPQSNRLTYYPLDGLFTESFQSIDVVINCAFARSHDPELLAQSFDFTERMIHCFEKMEVNKAINISSQGVYKRLPKGELSSENSPIAPVDLYSMSKYATEKMFRLSTIPYVVNVRLASLLMPQRFLYFFVQKAKSGEPFTVTAPNQYAALLDVNDAATGLVAIASMAHEKCAMVYNLGIGTQYSLLEYAESVKRIGDSLGFDVQFDVNDNHTAVCSGMNCSRLMHDTGWMPKVLKDEMIVRLFEESVD